MFHRNTLQHRLSTYLKPRTPPEHRQLFHAKFKVFFSRFILTGFDPILHDPAVAVRAWIIWLDHCGESNQTTTPPYQIVQMVFDNFFAEMGGGNCFNMGRMITHVSSAWEAQWKLTETHPPLFIQNDRHWQFSSTLAEMWLAAEYVGNSDLSEATKILGNPNHSQEAIRIFGYVMTWEIYNGITPPADDRLNELAEIVSAERPQNLLAPSVVQALVNADREGVKVPVTKALAAAVMFNGVTDGHDKTIKTLRDAWENDTAVPQAGV